MIQFLEQWKIWLNKRKEFGHVISVSHLTDTSLYHHHCTMRRAKLFNSIDEMTAFYVETQPFINWLRHEFSHQICSFVSVLFHDSNTSAKVSEQIKLTNDYTSVQTLQSFHRIIETFSRAVYGTITFHPEKGKDIFSSKATFTGFCFKRGVWTYPIVMLW